MALFRQKITAKDYFIMMLKELLMNDELFPSEDNLLAQDGYSKDELIRVRIEERKLAVVYTLLFVTGRTLPKKRLLINVAFYDALNEIFFENEYESLGFEDKYGCKFLSSIDDYASFIISKNEDLTGNDNDFLYGFKQFQDMVLKDRETLERPVSIIGLAKTVRHMVTMLGRDLNRRYRITF